MAVNILKLDASIRKTGSYSRALTDKLITQLSRKNKVNIISRDLADGVPFIDDEWGKANFTAVEERTEAQHASLLESDSYVAELMKSDVIVMGLPIYNFGVPASFKAWIDQVVRAKLTFRYTEDGPEGLLKDKKAYIVIASGGTELGTELDFISEYLRHILGFVGITDVTFIDSSGIGKDEETILSRSHALIEQL
jgi:FMN-dependent NADH-azoreductase